MFGRALDDPALLVQMETKASQESDSDGQHSETFAENLGGGWKCEEVSALTVAQSWSNHQLEQQGHRRQTEQQQEGALTVAELFARLKHAEIGCCNFGKETAAFVLPGLLADAPVFEPSPTTGKKGWSKCKCS